MGLRAKLYRLWSGRRKKALSPTQIIAITFAAIILAGTLLLMLPISSRNGESCDFLPSLFTATSATCVTGLVMFDTGTQWSAFGQTVILGMIEVGGLGFMSAASLVVFLLRKKVGLKQRMIMAQALSVSDMDSIVKLQKYVLFGSLGIQFAGAIILFFRFLMDNTWLQAAKWSVFHAVSAFCNAGFDIFGNGDSLISLNSDPVVLLTLGVLVVLGGLGFFVWEELVRLHSWKKFSVYTKLVLATTAVLLALGAAAFCILEWNNPATLGAMNTGDKLLNGVFQSITVRTAGFAAIDQAELTEAGKAVTMVFMLIGGSSGSTAGGIKTVTLVVLLLFLWARLRGRDTVCVFKRTIPGKQVTDAMTIASVVVSLALFGGIFICATSPVGFTDALYESVSALATVGTTAGVTPLMSLPAKILIIIYMYFGRVGVLTLSLGFLMGNKAEERYKYANTNLLIG